MTAPDSPTTPAVDPQWRWLLTAGGIAALIGVTMIPIQVIVFAVSPPPTDIRAWFALLIENPVMGMMNLDVLYILNNALLIPLYMALWLALRDRHEPVLITALIVGLVGVAAYFPSNTAFEMLRLSQQYAAATDPAQQAILLSAGEALTVKYVGTAFIVYYFLNAIALLMFAGVMLRTRVFSRATAYWGLAAGILMAVPSPFGTIGMVFALASLLPWAIFSLLIGRRLIQLGRGWSG